MGNSLDSSIVPLLKIAAQLGGRYPGNFSAGEIQGVACERMNRFIFFLNWGYLINKELTVYFGFLSETALLAK